MISYTQRKKDESLAVCQQRCVENPSCLSIYREVHPINNEAACVLYKKAYTKAEDTGGTIGGKPVPDRCWTLASRPPHFQLAYSPLEIWRKKRNKSYKVVSIIVKCF